MDLKEPPEILFSLETQTDEWFLANSWGCSQESVESSEPHQRIRRITSSYPPDPESPFFDETGTPMKPVARLTLSRQRLYEKSCDADDSTDTTTPADDHRGETIWLSSFDNRPELQFSRSGSPWNILMRSSIFSGMRHLRMDRLQSMQRRVRQGAHPSLPATG